METTRQNKIARLIQKELSEIFMLQTKGMKGVLVSVSACRISPDLSVCRAYLSVFPSERSEEIVKNINIMPIIKYKHSNCLLIKFTYSEKLYPIVSKFK